MFSGLTQTEFMIVVKYKIKIVDNKYMKLPKLNLNLKIIITTICYDFILWGNILSKLAINNF